MIVFADKQDITRVGLIHVADSLSEAPQYCCVEDKATLIETLNEESDAVVYLDYTMFDINDVAELQIIAQHIRAAVSCDTAGETAADISETDKSNYHNRVLSPGCQACRELFW